MFPIVAKNGGVLVRAGHTEASVDITKFAKRGLDCRTLIYAKEVQGSGNILRQEVELKTGISKDEAKKICLAEVLKL